MLMYVEVGSDSWGISAHLSNTDFQMRLQGWEKLHSRKRVFRHGPQHKQDLSVIKKSGVSPGPEDPNILKKEGISNQELVCILNMCTEQIHAFSTAKCNDARCDPHLALAGWTLVNVRLMP